MPHQLDWVAIQLANKALEYVELCSTSPTTSEKALCTVARYLHESAKGGTPKPKQSCESGSMPADASFAVWSYGAKPKYNI